MAQQQPSDVTTIVCFNFQLSKSVSLLKFLPRKIRQVENKMIPTESKILLIPKSDVKK